MNAPKPITRKYLVARFVKGVSASVVQDIPLTDVAKRQEAIERDEDRQIRNGIATHLEANMQLNNENFKFPLEPQKRTSDA